MNECMIEMDDGRAIAGWRTTTRARRVVTRTMD
jgi:hypothetical protein